MFLKSLPAGAYFVIWHRTEQRVHSLFLWGHSFHHFSFDKYFCSFITCQSFSRNRAMPVSKTGKLLAVETYLERSFKYLSIITLAPEISAAGCTSDHFFSGVWTFWFTLPFQPEESELPSTTKRTASESCLCCRAILLAFDWDAVLVQPRVDLAERSAPPSCWLLLIGLWLTKTRGCFSDELLTILHLKKWFLNSHVRPVNRFFSFFLFFFFKQKCPNINTIWRPQLAT